MRILITGGAGCLGSNLIEHWLPQGHEILVIDNFATGKREVLPPVKGLTVVEGSVTDAELVNRVFDEFKPTHVVHSAAAYKDPSDWSEDTATNVQGSINVAKASSRLGVKRLLNFQTALCYGRPQQIPIPADHPTAPFTSYGISKTAGEAFLFMGDVPVVSLRLANVTGPRLAIGPIPTFYKRLKAGQKCFCSDTVRDFLDMSDFLSIADLALEEGRPTGVFNVSTGEGHSIKEVFDAVLEYVGATLAEPVPVVPAGEDDVQSVVLDPRRTEEAFGWKAAVSFKDTITGQLAWYDKYGVTDIFSHLAAPKA
ncbi:NAD-dependent epimerase/dehydratase family protein [Achromobacter xylosoxidans]|uniref:NAD-dependent epimerase/dehydratase family protein n=1 Tax=Alcaligenes xylosoxydans xylosoxydans TaxID=85698 RepID=UPI001564EC6A|nr:NAD-dependent epimerase/dehydratase family protein [Achromobacter xylosoxidans]QKI70411.1 NAD-dependent epimerase/dehydratase family protein [Achromobacter xylosoxidans]